MLQGLKRLLRPLFQPVFGYRRWRAAQRYNIWLTSVTPDKQDLTEQSRLSKQFMAHPLISIVTPTYNTPIDYLTKMIDSVRSQSYKNWELILCDDASTDETVRDVIKRASEYDGRIRAVFLKTNQQIAEATNRAIDEARGSYIALLDHDDILYPQALFRVAEAINNNPKLSFIYSDEDKLDESRHPARYEPFLKPDWNPDLLRSINYITHFTVIAKDLLSSMGGEAAECNGAQDWELFLRITRSIEPSAIHHIPEVLYGWRFHDQSTAKNLDVKPYVISAQRTTLEKDATARSLSATITRDPRYGAQWRFEPVHEHAEVFYVVTGGNRDATLPAGTLHADTEADLRTALINSGAELVLFSEEMKCMDGAFTARMAGDAMRPDVGFVAATYPGTGYLENMKSLLGEIRAQVAATLGRHSLTNHVYRTTKYSVPSISDHSTAMIEREKLIVHLTNARIKVSVNAISRRMSQTGKLRHVYNPYL